MYNISSSSSTMTQHQDVTNNISTCISLGQLGSKPSSTVCHTGPQHLSAVIELTFYSLTRTLLTSRTVWRPVCPTIGRWLVIADGQTASPSEWSHSSLTHSLSLRIFSHSTETDKITTLGNELAHTHTQPSKTSSTFNILWFIHIFLFHLSC